MTDHDETHHDPDLDFERPDDYGQDYYEEQPPAGEAEYAEELPPEKPKSNLLINVAIFGGVGIFALVMAWVNFGSVLFPPKSAAPVDNSALLNPVQPSAPTAANQAQPVVPAPGMPPVITAANAPPVPGAPIDVSQMPPATGAQGAPTDVAALSVTPNAAVTPPPANVPGAPTTPITVTPTAPVTATANPGALTPAVTATATITPTVAPAMPAQDTGRIADLEKTNQDLTAKTAEQDSTIADLKSQLSDAQSKLSDAQSKLADAQAAKAMTPKPAATPKKKNAKAHVPTHVAKAKSPIAEEAANMPAISSGSGHLGDTLPPPPPYWVLRSAADNSAWVAHPGDNQLYQITVGDQLPGIGKIISIQQQAGAWVVVGTQGQIRQE